MISVSSTSNGCKPPSPTLRAVLVAIDNYPSPVSTLSGCINDLNAMKACLQKCCAVLELQFDPLILIDAAATRANVIKAFEHFKKAVPDDPCLFFYAGHGARSEAPPEFRDIESDGEMESIACYDSRTPGGFDLMDKELSYLIWRANEGKNLPFISIMDCCHAGQMRDAEEIISDDNNAAERKVRDLGPALPVDSFLGIETYHRSRKGQISPPIGRRIHLGACRDAETAKEVRVFVEQRSQQRGLFTYCLIEAFQQHGFFISYSDLLTRVQLRAQVIRTDQSPQLTAVQTGDKNLGFLSKAAPPAQKSALLTFRKAENRWAVNAGAIHGLEDGAEKDKNIVRIPEANGVSVEIEKVLSNYSLLKVFDTEGKSLNLNKTKGYTVVFQRLATHRIQLQAAPDCDAEMADAFRKYCEIKNSLLFQWNDQANASADLRLYAKDGICQLRYADGGQSLLGDINLNDGDTLDDLHRGVEMVSAWRRLLERRNPASNIGAEDIACVLYRITEAGNTSDDAPAEAVAFNQGAVEYRYGKNGAAWKQPAFRLAITNQGDQLLWVSVLYLSGDFSISNFLLPKHALRAGETVFAHYVRNTRIYSTIPLKIDKALLDRGQTTADEYMKVIISTEEPNTDSLEQQGISAMRSGPTRGPGDSEEQAYGDDWRSVEIPIRVIR